MKKRGDRNYKQVEEATEEKATIAGIMPSNHFIQYLTMNFPTLQQEYQEDINRQCLNILLFSQHKRSQNKDDNPKFPANLPLLQHWNRHHYLHLTLCLVVAVTDCLYC